MPRLLKAPWHTTAPLVPMLCKPWTPNSTRHELMLVQASARTKASLVLMVCETGALKHKRVPRLLEGPWRTKAALLPMLCQPGAPNRTMH